MPYSNGFGQEGGDEFIFLDDYDDDFIEQKKLRRPRGYQRLSCNDSSFWLINSKLNDSINTQFKRDDRVWVHPDLNFCDNEEILVSSQYGEVTLRVKNSTDIRNDCVKITANTIGVNRLTPPTISNEGHSACFGEVKVRLSKLVL